MELIHRGRTRHCLGGTVHGVDDALVAGAPAAQAEFVVLHVVDTPDVGAAVAARVLHRALASRGGLARAYFGDRPAHPVVLARRHWPGALAAMHGDAGAGAYLRTRADVENVDCSDLASGCGVDEPVWPATTSTRW